MTEIEAQKFYKSLQNFGIVPGLQRINALLEALGNPEKNVPSIHIAGTNGKGSVSTAIAEILKAEGFKTGLFTSPYIIDYRESLKVNSQMISKDKFAKITDRLMRESLILSKNNIQVTEFEALTGAAFLHFSQENCDLAVIETGMGGLSDSTNIIQKPLVSVLTSISIDHTNYLGDSLEQITREKCGIIKHGCPVVTCDTQKPEVLSLISKYAKEMVAPLIVAKIKDINSYKENKYNSIFFYDNNTIKIPVPGKHQAENIIIAIETLKALKDFKIHSTSIIKGVSKLVLPARIEVLRKKPLIIIDGSHNDASTKALADWIVKNLQGKKIIAIMGMMGDKDYANAVKNLTPLFYKLITTTPSNERALLASDLKKFAQDYLDNIVDIDSPKDALKTSFEISSSNDVILICGSFYLARELRDIV